nr:hypothetical protein Itr_chr02CG17450 [Ipomoea trifida]
MEVKKKGAQYCKRDLGLFEEERTLRPGAISCTSAQMQRDQFLDQEAASIIPAASAGDTCDAEFCLSEGLDTLKLPEELGLGVVGREELGELTTDDGYHDSVEQSGNLGESNCDVEWKREFESSRIAVLSSSLSLFSLRISFKLPGKSVSMYLRVLVDL